MKRALVVVSVLGLVGGLAVDSASKIMISSAHAQTQAGGGSAGGGGGWCRWCWCWWCWWIGGWGCGRWFCCGSSYSGRTFVLNHHTNHDYDYYYQHDEIIFLVIGKAPFKRGFFIAFTFRI